MALSLQQEKVSKAVSLVLSLTKENNKDDVFSGELPVQLQISVKKIPRDRNDTRLLLKFPHSTIRPGDDICLFVKDLDKTERDTEETIAFYKDLLARKGVEHVKEIVPVKGLKTDFKPFEAKVNLSNAYDIYLADERVVSCLPRLLGKSFYARKKVPVQIKIGSKDLKGEIDRALRKSKFAFSLNGTSSTATVGHCGMTQDDLTANVMAAVDQISSTVPGSCDNIRQLSIKTRSCTSIPIYMSAEGGPQHIKLKKPKTGKVKVEVDELSTLPDAKVAVYPDGKVLVIRDGQTLKQVMAADRKANNKRKSGSKDSNNPKRKSGSKDASKAKKPRKSNGASTKGKTSKKSKKIKQ